MQGASRGFPDIISMAVVAGSWQQGAGLAGMDAAGAAAVPVAAIAPTEAEEKLSSTWTHVVAVAGSEAKALDLMELLNGARREDTYQFPIPGVSTACQHTLGSVRHQLLPVLQHGS